MKYLKSLWKGIFGYPVWRASYVLVIFPKETIIAIMHLRGLIQSRKYKKAKNLKLHLGCGTKIKPSWLNIDISPYADISLDFRRPLPFADGSCSAVYSEHLLEHLAYPELVDFFLNECRRVLQHDGIFSAGVPDTEWPIREYLEGPDSEYYRIARQEFHPDWCETRMEHINYHFRQGDEHKFAYDYETLEHVLCKAGFSEVHRRDFDPELDSEDRKIGTLYVVATK